MYRRFLNNGDYLSIITKDALLQLIRNDESRISQAEESAEISIIEHLSENYEIEQELNKGKYIAGYERKISYPVGVHIYYEDKIYEVIRSISGFKQPCDTIYWQEHIDISINPESIKPYSQLAAYYANDIVLHNDVMYICRIENGYKFDNIRIPDVNGWIEKEVSEWLPVDYSLWDVVQFEDSFYTLVSLEDFDNNQNPEESDNWGAIADYSSDCNDYELSEHEYVVYNKKVFFPEIDVNADIPAVGINLSLHDPRNYNLKKHLVRLSLYELTKLIASNNVSVVRLRDYEDSMKWLQDASRLKLNPQIPRKLAEDKKPVTDWQLATFQNAYDPYKNPWMT